MTHIDFDDRNVIGQFISETEVSHIKDQVESAHQLLQEGGGPGSDFLGWLNLPTDYDRDEFTRIKQAAEKIKGNSEILIVIGIGAVSYTHL